jgi:hypothetical protein
MPITLSNPPIAVIGPARMQLAVPSMAHVAEKMKAESRPKPHARIYGR